MAQGTAPTSGGDTVTSEAERLLADFAAFSRATYPARPLRGYQLDAAAPILAAVMARQGGNFVILFSRQAGKDELLAQLNAYLLATFREQGGTVVMAAPTYNPQCLISQRRLVGLLDPQRHPGARQVEGRRVACGNAAAVFLSAEESANVRGETASLLLIANEAQDIRCDIWDSRFAPMTASTNAPVVFSGTPWDQHALLSREMKLTPAFRADWRRVAAEAPSYGAHVQAQIAKLGEKHPLIRTEYCLEELPGRKLRPAKGRTWRWHPAARPKE